MEDILDRLVKIQKLDDDIKTTQSRIVEIPLERANLEKEIEKAQRNVTEKQTRIQNIKRDYIMKEGDLAENENKMNKLNQQTFAVKTNEEYRALINEIDYLKQENKRIEDEMINLLEEEEKLKNTISKIENETEDLVNERTREMNELAKGEKELIEKSEQLQISFDEHFMELPIDVRELYNKIKRVRGKVVCLIRNETCTGCYANLTPQFLNELKRRKEILLCDSCGRILVYTHAEGS